MIENKKGKTFKQTIRKLIGKTAEKRKGKRSKKGNAIRKMIGKTIEKRKKMRSKYDRKKKGKSE